MATGVDPGVGAGRPRVLALALGAALVFVLLYLFAVQTELGQRIDDAALRGSERAPERAQDGSEALLRTISIGSLAFAVVTLGGLASLRRRPLLIVLPALVVGASLGATEVLKDWILPRPGLVDPVTLPENSYPSGHTTIGISLALAAVLVTAPALRAHAGLLAAGFAAMMGVLVVTASWHRPSDSIGSYALSVAITAAITAALYQRAPEAAGSGRTAPRVRGPGPFGGRIELAALGAGGLLFAGAILLASLRYGPDANWTRPDAAFLGSAAGITAAAGVAVGVFIRALSPPGPD